MLKSIDEKTKESGVSTQLTPARAFERCSKSCRVGRWWRRSQAPRLGEGFEGSREGSERIGLKAPPKMPASARALKIPASSASA